MGTYSMGHLSVATGTTENPAGACNMTSLNGSASACDFTQFVASISLAGITAVPNPCIYRDNTDINLSYLSEGTRYNVRISHVNGNYTWSITTGGTFLSIASQNGDYIQGTGERAGGSDTVRCIWIDGYNAGATKSKSITVSDPD